MEPIQIRDDGSIPQVEMTSCGPNGGPLRGKGEFPASIACNLFCRDEAMYTGELWMNTQFPKITQDGKDGDQEPGYIANMTDSATAGFKYFDCRGVRKFKIKVRGYCRGVFEVKTSWNGPGLCEIPVQSSTVWMEYSADLDLPDGVHAIYLTFRGQGRASLLSFTLEQCEF